MGAYGLMSQPNGISNPHTDMTTESTQDASESSNRELSEDPEDGRIFGHPGRYEDEQGNIDTELFPDDTSDTQKEILRYAMLNPEKSVKGLWRHIVDEEYDGDEDEAPSYSWVYNTLREYDAQDRPHALAGRKVGAADTDGETASEDAVDGVDVAFEDVAAVDEDDSDEESETVTQETGNRSYEGPAEGLNLAEQEQYIGDRPVKVVEDADSGTGESAETPLSTPGESSSVDDFEEFEAGIGDISTVTLTDDEIVRLLSRLGEGDEALIQRLASYISDPRQ